MGTKLKSFMQIALARTRYIGTPPPPIVPFADWDYYYLFKDLEWKSDAPVEGAVNEVKVPAGFVTDLASIPDELWSVLPPAARYSYPAIVHDYLYWFQTCERVQADTVFKAAMEDLKVTAGKIMVIYNAVRLAGGTSWDANAKAKAIGERRVLKKYPPDVLTTWTIWKQQPDVFA